MRHASRILLTTLATLACALTLAACGGGGDTAAYEDGLRAIQQQLDAASEASASVPADADDAARAAALEQAHEDLAAAADRAAELDPPDDVRDAHEDLVQALRDYADLFARLAQAPSDDPAAVTALYGEAGEIVDRLGAANEAIEEAGYRVGDEG
jgi:hypothetical protein